MNQFRMKDLGNLHSFLGVNIVRTEDEIKLSQSTYLKKLLKRFGMEECRPVKTPMELKPDLHEDVEITDTSRSYRELVGCLMYVMLTTRPYLSVAVNYFSRHQNRQTEKLWNGLKRVLRYIKGTLDMQLCFRKGIKEYLCYTDADFGSEVDRKSTSGYIIQVYGNPVLWSTRRQSTVAQSSTEAEYVALASAVADLIWMKNLLMDLGVELEKPPKVFEDNQSVIHLLNQWEHRRLKHVDVKYNFVRDYYLKGVIQVEYVNTKEQIADILTKALNGGQFLKLRELLNLE